MSRFLFVVPPLVGHVMPAAGVAEEVRQRGHEVAWVAHEVAVGHLLGEGARLYDVGDELLVGVGQLLSEHDRLRGPASLHFLWERFLIPLALDMTDPVRKAVDDFRPDVLVTDQQAFAGAIVATQLGVPWAVSASNSAELRDPFAAVPKIGGWVQRQLQRLYDKVGLSDLGAGEYGFDPRFSPYLTIQYSTEALVGPLDRDLPTVAFVGPVLRQTDTGLDERWREWLGRHDRNVLVSLGTVTQHKGVRFLRATLEAVAGAPYGVVMVGPDGLAPGCPDNVAVHPAVPQVELLPSVDLVVCHAGHNTVAEALSFGIPLVCAPIREDQPTNAANVVRAGAGRRLSFARARPAEIRSTIDEVLAGPAYRDAAERIAASFRSAGGAVMAADLLEALSTRRGRRR